MKCLLVVSTVALAAIAAGCTSGVGVYEPPLLPPEMTLSEMGVEQQTSFCNWVQATVATCPGDGSDTAPPASDQTPLQQCLTSFIALPDCTVAQYDACQRARYADPCAAARDDACVAVVECAPQPASLGAAGDVPEPRPIPWADALHQCSIEVFLGGAGGLWATRQWLDRARQGTYYPVTGAWLPIAPDFYCADYYSHFGISTWVQDRLCVADPQRCWTCFLPTDPGCPERAHAVAYGCTGCHGIEADLPGRPGVPSFTAIGQRYLHPAHASLEVKVMAGTSGTWGTEAMPPQLTSRITHGHVVNVVGWILGLGGH